MRRGNTGEGVLKGRPKVPDWFMGLVFVERCGSLGLGADRRCLCSGRVMKHGGQFRVEEVRIDIRLKDLDDVTHCLAQKAKICFE